jgi:WD40 repeat protein
VAFSPEGKLLASASEDSTVKLWEAGSEAALQTLEGYSSWVNAVAFSPDGKLLASVSADETVKLWDAGSGAVLQTSDVGNKLDNLSFSDDGTPFSKSRRALNSTTSLSLKTGPFSEPIGSRYLSHYLALTV